MRLILACASAGGLGWCIASLWHPFGWDHGIFAAVGNVIVRGGMPYRDGWDTKGPLAYYIYALGQWIFGRHMWGVRILDVVLLLAACLALMRMVTSAASPTAGRWTAIGFLFWYASLGWFFTSQPDGWVAMFMLLGTGPLLVRSTRLNLPRLALCGFLVGCCGLIKPFYLAFALVPLVYVFTLRRTASAKRFALSLAITSSAAGLPPLLMAGWFAYRGALEELIQVHFVYNMRVYSGPAGVPLLEGVRVILAYFLGGFVAIALPAALLGAYGLWRERRAVGASLVAWFAVALFCVALQGKFYEYHWIPVFPPLAALTGVGLWMLASAQPASASRPHDEFPLRPARTFTFIAGAFLLGQLAISPAFEVARWLKFVSGRTEEDIYYAWYARSKYVAGDNMKAAQYLREHTGDGDQVAIWGNDATITFLSGRANPTRFVFALPLTYGGPNPMRATYRREYLNELRRTLPVYVVVGLPWGHPVEKEPYLADFPEFVGLLHTRYRLETRIGFLDLYRLLPE